MTAVKYCISPFLAINKSEIRNTLQNERKKSRLEQISNNRVRAGGDSAENVTFKNRREIKV